MSLLTLSIMCFSCWSLGMISAFLFIRAWHMKPSLEEAYEARRKQREMEPIL